MNITRNGRIISSYINKSEVQEIKLRDIPEKKAPLKESYLNFGIGYGPNYGIFGTKTVFGINNSGLLIGLGRTPFGTTGFEIGVQVTVKWFFINYGLATAGVHQYDDEPYENDTNFYVTLGGMVDLGKSKRTFLDLGFGFRTGKDNLDYFSHSETDDYRFNGAIGIGFRFGI